MPTSPPGRTEGGGFTLVELVLVLAIVSLLLLTVLPKIPSIIGGTGEETISLLTGRIEALLTEAPLSGEGGILTITIPDGPVTFSPVDEKGRSSWEVSLLPHYSVKEVKTNFGITYTEGKVKIPLSPSGFLPETRLILVDRKTGEEVALTVDPFEGRVRGER
ncbi:MAG: prepilin-type N-terminal cleavage/methylation domain-containing protein [Deltaproteobacteria bacterium]|nr:MAG: prepilin-type N-terminal cleavage/methylation domain-containing protein [Deltaproteobacteria bacterium]